MCVCVCLCNVSVDDVVFFISFLFFCRLNCDFFFTYSLKETKMGVRACASTNSKHSGKIEESSVHATHIVRVTGRKRRKTFDGKAPEHF